ncbi:MAG: chromosome partitioning protein [Jatrophihabitans sp.]
MTSEEANSEHQLTADGEHDAPSGSRHAHRDDESWRPPSPLAQGSETGPQPYFEPAAYETRPPVYDRQPPPYAEPPVNAEVPAFTDQTGFPEPPTFVDPPPTGPQPFGAPTGQPPSPFTEQTVQRSQLPTFDPQGPPPAQATPDLPPQDHPYVDPYYSPSQSTAPQDAAPQQRAPQPYPQEQQPTAYHQPPPAPRPEDLLVPNQPDVTADPASWGWRGKVNRGSGGLIKAKPAPVEVAAREAIQRIQRSFSRPMTVVVVQPKGGAGKTPTTICLSAAFGAHRGGYVVGWDDNETRGTLAVRVNNPDNQRATVWDLLSDLPAFERYDARVGDLSYYVRAQPDAHFDALVSDDNPGNMAQIGENEFQRLHQVLQRFYRMIVVDTGNNVRSPNWQAAVSAADLVVVVSTYQRDVGWSASWVLDHLAQTGREELARNAVTVLSAADPTSDKVVREQLLGHFRARTRAVIEIPYDAQLAHGGPINWTALAPATRNAWVQAGATVVDALAERDDRTLAERRP